MKTAQRSTRSHCYLRVLPKERRPGEVRYSLPPKKSNSVPWMKKANINQLTYVGKLALHINSHRPIRGFIRCMWEYSADNYLVVGNMDPAIPAGDIGRVY